MTTNADGRLASDLCDVLGPLPDGDWTGGTLAYTAEQMHAYASEQVAAERLRMLDCRTCRHTTAYGGCMSVLQCATGSAYQRGGVRQYWRA